LCAYRGLGPNQNYAEVGHMKVGMGSRDLLLIFLDLLIFPKWLKLDTSARAVRVVHSMQPLPNYFGFCFHFIYFNVLVGLLLVNK